MRQITYSHSCSLFWILVRFWINALSWIWVVVFFAFVFVDRRRVRIAINGLLLLGLTHHSNILGINRANKGIVVSKLIL